MSISTRYRNPIVISDLTPNNDSSHILDETGGTSVDGWDTLNLRILIYGTQVLGPEHLDTDYPVGSKLGSRQLWNQGFSNWKCHGGHVYTATLHFKGLLSNKPVVVDYDAAADQQQGTDVGTPDGTFESVSTHEATPTATVRYITLDVANNKTAQVGTELTPPSAPGVAPSVWTNLAKFTYHWPNGWVLMASKVSPMRGTSVGLVQDQYKFIRARTPRS